LLGIYFFVNKPVFRLACFRALAISAVLWARRVATADELALAVPCSDVKRPDGADLPMTTEPPFFGAAMVLESPSGSLLNVVRCGGKGNASAVC